jgi:predicted nucleic acid-binding protein
MKFIVDASVAVKWYLAETDSGIAHRILLGGHDFIAPDLLLVELANALYKAWLNGAIDDVHTEMALGHIPQNIRTFFPVTDLVADAVVISRILRHSVYDCVYLALAWQTGAKIVTADERFFDAARAMSWEMFLVHLHDAV